MNVGTIGAAELDSFVGRADVIIVDVRNKNDFVKKHIAGAVNIPADEIGHHNLPKNCLIIVYCERGATSLVAARKLLRAGYNVKSVVGGLQAYHGRFSIDMF